MSQLTLARQVGAAQSTVSDIEAEKLLPNVALALRIAHALGVSVEDIIWRDEATRYRKKPAEALAD
jgi:DNA-binding XRE family transcriptional regulator